MPSCPLACSDIGRRVRISVTPLSARQIFDVEGVDVGIDRR